MKSMVAAGVAHAKLAVTVTALFGMVNVVFALFALAKVTAGLDVQWENRWSAGGGLA